MSWTPVCLLFKHTSDHVIIQKALGFFGTQYWHPKISLCYKISLLISAFDEYIFSVYKKNPCLLWKLWWGGEEVNYNEHNLPTSAPIMQF